MKQSIPLILYSCFLVLLLSGCSSFNCTRLENLLGADINLVSLGQDIGDELIDNSFPPLLPRDPEQPVLVATLVNNSNLKSTSNFGRSLQNSIAAAFVRRGYTVNEVKLRGDVHIRSRRGEFMLSRELEDLRDRQKAQAVVVGTYSLSSRQMYLSVRLVNVGSGSIRSVYEQRVCLDENTLQMLGFVSDHNEDMIDAPSEPVLDKVLYWEWLP